MEKEYNMEDKIFTSLDLSHKIEIKIIQDISWFNILEFDYSKQKTFVLLFKEVVEYFQSKNVKWVKQYIMKEDVGYFKNSTVNEIEENVFIVCTPIIHFVNEMVSVLGIIKI
jgi:hypothetical protein